MEPVVNAIAAVPDRLVDVLMMPFDPGARIYFANLASAALIAWLISRSVRSRRAAAGPADVELAQGSFKSLLLPRKVGVHPSAWFDLRYMGFHKVVSHFLLLGNGGWALAAGFRRRPEESPSRVRSDRPQTGGRLQQSKHCGVGPSASEPSKTRAG